MSGNGSGNGQGRNNNVVTCYQKQNGKIINFNGTACGDPSSTSPIQCCQRGDTCLPDHTCYFGHTLSGASGYYVAPCTDPQHKDPNACSDRCSQLPVLDVVFDPKSNLWACCNATANGQRHCDNPSDETFQADSPSSLLAAATATSASLSVTPTAAVTPTTTVSPPASPAAASGLSAGASAGIGVGAGVGGILIVAAIAFFAVRGYRRRKAREREGATVRPSGGPPADEPTPMYPGSGMALADKPDEAKKDPVAAGAAELGHSKTVKPGADDPNRRSELPVYQPVEQQPLMELDNNEIPRSR